MKERNEGGELGDDKIDMKERDKLGRFIGRDDGEGDQ